MSSKSSHAVLFSLRERCKTPYALGFSLNIICCSSTVIYWPSTEPSIKRCTCVNKQRKQVAVRQLYNQVPQTSWVSSSWSWSQLGTRCPCENQRQTEGSGSSVTHSWAPQPRWERSAAMVRITLGQYVTVCPRLQLPSHTQPASTLSWINCKRYISIKKYGFGIK